MKRLLFVSLAIIGFSACSKKTIPTRDAATEKSAAVIFWTNDLRDTLAKNTYSISIDAAGAHVSGLCVAKRIDGAWRGIFMNEFGVKMCDFVSTEKQCELLNVVPMMDKWYIKQTLASDLQFLFEVDNPSYKIGTQSVKSMRGDTLTVIYKDEKMLQRFAHDEIKLTNKKHDIGYSLKRINE